MLGTDSSNSASGGDQSQFNQAQTINNNNYGLSYSDVKELFLDLFRSNFIDLKNEAAKIASERAEEITTKLVERLQQENQGALDEFKQPGMQDSLFNAQKEYAKAGDPELADMLVQMLIDRAKSPIRNRRQAVLDEGLRLAPKLSIHQMDLLTITQHFFLTKQLLCKNFDGLMERLEPLFQLVNHVNIAEVNADIEFLEYLGLVTKIVGSFNPYEKLVLSNYQIYFDKGFQSNELERFSSAGLNAHLIPSFHVPENMILGFESKDQITPFLSQYGYPEHEWPDILALHGGNLLTEDEVVRLLSDRFPGYVKLREIFNNTEYKNFNLSPVGISIALANWQRRTGVISNLATWVG